MSPSSRHRSTYGKRMRISNAIAELCPLLRPPLSSSASAGAILLDDELSRRSLNNPYINHTGLSPVSVVDPLGSAPTRIPRTHHFLSIWRRWRYAAATNLILGALRVPLIGLRLGIPANCPARASTIVDLPEYVSRKHLARPLPSMRLSSWPSLPSSSRHLSIPVPTPIIVDSSTSSTPPLKPFNTQQQRGAGLIHRQRGIGSVQDNKGDVEQPDATCSRDREPCIVHGKSPGAPFTPPPRTRSSARRGGQAARQLC
ncbi:hypothetical protein FA95DRAFT_928039 [Auriscalpium vulgare]|uniref:Uncharacterized protein n=1 Tax=Auriscalpium vulgare TaxID=40419 RepID=A0ACB8R810_9AGAM|nr:hypothetical protein FA95DRAFT_928039 [Auriscalpium vulgare]